VLKLRKTIERIKQAAHLWFKLNHDVPVGLDCIACIHEPNLYCMPCARIIIGVFADNILVDSHWHGHCAIQEVQVRIRGNNQGRDHQDCACHHLHWQQAELDRERGTIALRQVNRSDLQPLHERGD